VANDYKFVQGSCATQWCPNERRKTREICSSCAAALARAENKGEIWVRMRHDTVSKFQARMVYLGTERNKEFSRAATQIKRRKF
jgi:hypothetical protein